MATREAALDADGPVVQAHRGFDGVLPENTVFAARTAAERFGADWIEVDVQPTDDETVVCFHDPGLGDEEGSRDVADADGLVRDSPDEKVLGAVVLDSGETVPRLVDVLAALPPEVGVNVELKSPGSPVDSDDWVLDADAAEEQRATWDDFVADVAGIVADVDRPLVFSSFFEGALAAAAEHAPDVPRAVIAVGDLEDGMGVADRQDAEAINAPADLLTDAGSPFVARAHDANLAVNAWTVTEWTTCRDLAAIGVDGLIAKYPFLDAAL